jgi:hypothetical protein
MQETSDQCGLALMTGPQVINRSRTFSAAASDLFELLLSIKPSVGSCPPENGCAATTFGIGCFLTDRCNRNTGGQPIASIDPAAAVTRNVDNRLGKLVGGL